MGEQSSKRRQHRDLTELTNEGYDEIVNDMMNAVKAFAHDRLDADAQSRLSDPDLLKKLRTALFDCMMFYAEFQFSDPLEDEYRFAREAKEAAKLLAKAHQLLVAIPEGAKRWYGLHSEDDLNPLNEEFLSAVLEASAAFKKRSRAPRGKKANFPLNLAVEPAIKAVEIVVGRGIHRALVRAKDRDDGFVDADAGFVAQIFFSLDSNIKSEQVKTAMQNYFSDKKIK